MNPQTPPYSADGCAGVWGPGKAGAAEGRLSHTRNSRERSRRTACLFPSLILRLLLGLGVLLGLDGGCGCEMNRPSWEGR